MKKSYLWNSLASAIGVLLYTGVVAWLLSNGQRLFGKVSNFLLPLFLLLLLIVSATVTGLLVLGRPLQLYLNNLKKEAVSLLLFTLAWLVLFAILVVLAILLL